MKKRAFLLSLLCLMMVAANRERVTAAACGSVSKYGAITVNIPKLPTSDTYNIWTRMQVPDDTHTQYRLEINGQICYEVGGSSITPGQWTWVSFQDGDLSSKVRYDFDNTVNNTAKLIGNNPGVKVDRLLLIKGDCEPVVDGSNCQSDNVAVSPINLAGATLVPPPSTGPVSGLIEPSQTITQDPELVMKVIYAVDGKQIPTTNGIQLDTTLLSNGSHQVAMQITRTNGAVINEATTLVVQNPQNALSPIRRWIRLNQHATVVASSIVGGILVVAAAFLIVRHIHLKKRLLEFRGF